MKKILLIIIDGLGDESIPQLGNKTPLEAAKTPNLDFLAKNGICGLVLPWVEKGKLPTSEDTHLALFSFDPKISNPGRGVFEVLGIGAKISKGDLCLRGNFATVNERLEIVDRRAGRIENTQPLIDVLNKTKIEGAKILIKKAVSHRIGIIIKSKRKLEIVSQNDPKKVGVEPLKIYPQGFTAKILNEFLEKTHQIFKNHPLNKKRERQGKLPANYILFRGAGKLKKIKKFKEKYGLKSAFIAGGALYKGIGRYLGMEEIKVKGANALPNTNLRGKILAAKNGLRKYDFIFCHIKAADNLAEDGNFLSKKEFIGKIDKSIKPLLNLKDNLIAVTADHSTCSILKSHCKIPIPILIYSNGAKKLARLSFAEQKLSGFSEKECQRGKLGKIKQIDLMKKILKYARGIY